MGKKWGVFKWFNPYWVEEPVVWVLQMSFEPLNCYQIEPFKCQSTWPTSYFGSCHQAPHFMTVMMSRQRTLGLYECYLFSDIHAGSTYITHGPCEVEFYFVWYCLLYKKLSVWNWSNLINFCSALWILMARCFTRPDHRQPCYQLWDDTALVLHAEGC